MKDRVEESKPVPSWGQTENTNFMSKHGDEKHEEKAADHQEKAADRKMES